MRMGRPGHEYYMGRVEKALAAFRVGQLSRGVRKPGAVRDA